MSEIFVPLALAFIGFIAAFSAYRSIRRGGARFYTLEREAILRRASFSLVVSVLFFLGAVGMLAYERQQQLNEDAAAAGEFVEGVETPTPPTTLETFPPTVTHTPTPDFSIPTATPTPIICRAVVESVNGLILRDVPGGDEISILDDGAILNLITNEPATETNGFVWRKVRSVFGDEGWVAEEFIIIGAPCE